MSSYPVISVNHISKLYKLYNKPVDRLKESLFITKKPLHSDHFALSDISFSVGKGECLGIIGTNGSGKSTLLKIITGVLNPTEGEVTVDGKVSALLELGAGFNMDYTGIENIFLNGTMMGFTKEEMAKKIDSIIEFAEIGDFINQPVKTYSSGMFARLAFAVAINVDPDILIVDEALSVGDIFFQAKCYRKFNEFKENGKTILFVSHDLNSVLKYCDRCLLINKGKQVELGKSKDVINVYKKILTNQYDADDKNKTSKDNTIQKGKKEQFNNTWKSHMISNTSCVEYGMKDAEIVDYALFDKNGDLTTTIEKNTRFTIKTKIHFNETIENPIFTFTIKDRKGTIITGTNTLLEGNTLDCVESGTDVIVSFDQLMNLQGGQYLLSVSCTGYDMDKLIIHHRLYDVCFFEVFSTKDTVGYFDMDSKVSYIAN